MKTQWYVIYFKGRSEKKLAGFLTRKRIENYYPLYREDNAANSLPVDKPVFNSYLFVRTTEKQILTIRRMPAVISVVHWLGRPVVITDDEIDLLKRFLNDHVNIKVEKIALGSQVIKTASGVAVEEDGLFKLINQRTHIVLPSLGYKIFAEEISSVRIISPDVLVHKVKVKPSRSFNPIQLFSNF